MEHEILLDVRHLTHIFPLSRKTAVKAVDDVSFQIRRGEIFGLVGESGSGKSTAARCVMNIYQPYAGQIYYKGIDTCDRGQFRKNKKMLQTTRQMIFQDSGSSLNQKMKVRDIIEEPMRVQKIRPLRGSYEEEARFQMKYVGLDPEYLKKYPGELSGGQRQRVAGLDVGVNARHHDIAHLQALRLEDVALLAVNIVQQSDACVAVRVVLDGSDLRGHAVLVALEIDYAVTALIAATLMTGGDATVIVAAGLLRQRLQQRLFRLAGGDVGEIGHHLEATAGTGRLVLLDSHCFPFSYFVGSLAA